MATVTDEQIRELAYQLWERDGSPEGKDHDYWHAAKELLEDEGDVAGDDEPSVVTPVLPIPPAGLK